jgi:hypothetical protein
VRLREAVVHVGDERYCFFKRLRVAGDELLVIEKFVDDH